MGVKMKYIKVTTQKQFDKIPLTSNEYRVIQITETKEIVYVKRALGNSTVEALGNSTVEAWGNSTVEAWDNSTVEALGNSTVEAWGNSTVEAWDNSTVKAFATACVHLMSPSAQVVLFGFAVAFQMVKAII